MAEKSEVESEVDVDLFDWRLVKALSHPTRAHALTVCTHRAASPKEIAAELDREVNHVSYHINQLLKLNCIELVETKKRRNADEHFYRATVRHYFTPAAWKTVPDHARLKLRIDLVKMVSSEAATAARAHTLDTIDNHMSRTALRVDKQGWNELAALLDETLEGVLVVKENAAMRLGESDELPVDARVSLLHFEIPSEQS